MHPKSRRSVFKYFDLADRFVRIRVCDPAEAGMKMRPDLDRKAYRREVIRACAEGFEDDIEAKMKGVFPEDPEGAEDLLYLLVVTVNPGLDIHSISLEGDRQAAPKDEARSRDFPAYLRRRVRGLEDRLRARIVGQDDAVERVTRAARRAAAGLADSTAPIASLLFVGRTGTGKTELARALAEELFGDSQALVRIDCTELAQAHEASKLIGAPPGYVGHEDGGLLTESMRKCPESIVLFDEIEKAHSKVHHLLLQVLDAGHLTDGRGRRVGFERSLVILTSNSGAWEMNEAERGLGFHRPGLDDDDVREFADVSLSRTFSPEFLGRIDETVLFRDLGPAEARRIAELRLAELAQRVRRSGVKIQWTEPLAAWVAEQGFSSRSGAREIARVVRREIEAPLADRILDDRRGGRFRLGLRGGRPHVQRARLSGAPPGKAGICGLAPTLPSRSGRGSVP